MTKGERQLLAFSVALFLVGGIWAPLLGARNPFSEEAKLSASDGASGEYFGSTVAISGDTVVVGASQATVGAKPQQGAVYLFVKPQGGWASAQMVKLTASDGAAGDLLGASVAISGDTVAAGAPGATIRSNVHQGTVYVFVKPPGGWVSTSTFDAKLEAPDGVGGDALGWSVAVSGGTVVTGAPLASLGAGAGSVGAAYVAVEPSSGWAAASTFDAKLSASDQAMGAFLGSSVGISGDTVVAGGPGLTIGSRSNSVVLPGAVFVFVKPPTGWVSTSISDATLTSGVAGDDFGISVAIAGKTVVAGALNAAFSGPIPASGAAYVFVEPAPGWASTATFDAELRAPDGVAGEQLGNSVAIFGDTVLAGTRVGTAYVFDRPSSGWFSTSAYDVVLTHSDPIVDPLGWSVAISGDTVVTGSPFATAGFKEFQGAAYVFGPLLITPVVPTPLVPIIRPRTLATRAR